MKRVNIKALIVIALVGLVAVAFAPPGAVSASVMDTLETVLIVSLFLLFMGVD